MVCFVWFILYFIIISHMKTQGMIWILAISTALFSIPWTIFADAWSYNTGNPTLDKVFTRYEGKLRSKNDTERLKQFSRESSKINNRKISDDLKDLLIENQITGSSGSNLGNEIAKKISRAPEQKMALKQLLNSLKKTDAGTYRLFIKTPLTYEQLTDTFSFFDNVTLQLISSGEDGKNIYELGFSYKGRLAKFLWARLESGDIPLNLFDNVETIQPVFVQNLVSTGTYLGGESLSNLWWMQSIGAIDYQYGLSKIQKIRVGVIDTGINLTHPDLLNNIGTGAYVWYNFIARNSNANDDNGHGTHVAWIIGWLVNAQWVFGVNSNVTLVPLKVLDANGYGSSYAIVDAINYGANLWVKVLNLSLGGSGNPANDIICGAITAAKNKGTITIVAAGNENIDVSTTVPAGCADAITVGAVDSNVKKASFSNYGSKVDVSAPGVNIYSSYLNSSYATLNGTSMATPFVAGLAAAILAYNPSFSTDKMRTLFKDPNNTLPVNSSVNLGRYINMSKIMTSLAVPNDSLIDGAPTNSGSTNTGTTNSWATNSGSTNSGSTNSWVVNTGTTTPVYSPVLVLSLLEVSPNAYKITATASWASGAINWYAFSNGTTLLASGALNTYQLTIAGPTTITVRSRDGTGFMMSKDISLTYKAPVIAPVNQAPTLSLTASAPNKKTNRVTISTSDSDGTIARVDIYINGLYTYYAKPNTQKFSANLDFAKGRSYIVRVISRDNKGVTTEKSITVK